MEIYLIILISFLSALWIGFLIIIRGIQFAYSSEEDTARMILASSTASKWRWPSDMHKPDNNTTYMKDMAILLLVIFQNIFRDKKGVYPFVAMQGFTNIVSAFFIFLIGSNYWGYPIGFFVSILFVVSFWPWHPAISMGHIGVATMFFLMAIYCVTQTSGMLVSIPDKWLFSAGLFFCFMLFASSSSFKYTPLFLSAIFFSRFRNFFLDNDLPGIHKYLFHNFISYSILYIWIPVLIFAFLFTVKLSTKRIVGLLYYGKSPILSKLLLKIFHRRMAGKDKFNLDHYLEYANYKISRIIYWSFVFYFSFILLTNFVGYEYLSSILLGLFTAFLILTLPNPKRVFGYYCVLVRDRMFRQKNTFRHWIKYFANRGITVHRRTKGGWRWLIRLIPRFIPFQIGLAVFLFIFLLINSIVNNDLSGLELLMVVLLIALSPIIWGDYTNGPVIARSNVPGLVSIIIFLGYGLNKLPIESGDLIFYLSLFSIITLGWNLWVFVTDILPSRMTITKLLNAFKKYDIKEFYTYKTDFQVMLLDIISPEILKTFKIHYVESLAQVHDGWIVIPGTCNKLSMMCTEKMSIDITTTGEAKDFHDDPILDQLLETKQIEKLATEKFKTMGSSRFWLHDHEVFTYLDLLLHEITPADHFRAYAWLINARDLKLNRSL